jgi:hypothetical protein
VDKIFPIFILIIIGINLLGKWLAEQGKQQQAGTRERKQYPKMYGGEDGTPRVVGPMPRQEQRPVKATRPGEVLRRMDRQFEEWFEEEQREEGRVVYEATPEDVEDYLEATSETAPPVVHEQVWGPPPSAPRETLRVPPPLAREEVRPRIEPAPPPAAPAVTAPQESLPKRWRMPRPTRRRVAPVQAVLPAGVFQNLDDVRRGIIMSEILGPPTAFK